jgi:hypothetical protein
MPLDPALRRAYERTDYVVFGEPELVFHVGEPSPDLDALMADAGVTTAAYLTAANPDGEQQDEDENYAAAAALLRSTLLIGLPAYEGEGRDPRGEWPAEPSVLVLGIERKDAEVIGVTHAQNAIVFIERGKAPELVVLV